MHHNRSAAAIHGSPVNPVLYREQLESYSDEFLTSDIPGPMGLQIPVFLRGSVPFGDPVNAGLYTNQGDFQAQRGFDRWFDLELNSICQ